MAYRLILADDSITIQKVVELTLSDEDFEVTSYGDGESALDAARRTPPDIILADVFMPKMGGYELCGNIRQDPALKDVPVLLMVGTFESFDHDAAARAGADDHITKPFESYELISKIKRLIDLRRAMREEELMAELVEDAELVEEAVPFHEAELVEEAGFVEEAELAGEILAAEPALADDLWSVVDLQSETQPLTGATEILTEEELWRRANLVLEPEEGEAAQVEEEVMPWDEFPGEPVMEAVEADEFLEAAEPEDALTAVEYESFPEVSVQEEPEAEAAAILDLDEPGAYAFSHDGPDGPAMTEVAEPFGPVGMPEIESLDEATVADEFESPVPAAGPSAAPLSPEAMKEEILKAVNSLLDQKIREALSAISRDVIEQVVWEVVPGLAEEIIVKEIEKLKAGVK